MPYFAAHPQSVLTLMGARACGLAYASSTIADEWSALNNIAGIALHQQPSLSFAFDAHAAVPGSNRIAATYVAPYRSGVVAASLFRFGDAVYSEQIISTGYANHRGLASLGLKLNYVQYAAEGFGSNHCVSLDLGGLATITPTLAVSGVITNVTQSMISSTAREYLPTRLTSGIRFQPSPPYLLVLEIEKDLIYRPVFKAAFEYVHRRKIAWRTGINLKPNAYFLGIGYTMRRVKIDFALSYSLAMSLAQQASVTWFTNSKSKMP